MIGAARCQARGFHSTAASLVRKSFKAPTLRPPVPPSASNLKVREDHPLWQFFTDKKYVRSASDLDNIGRAWTVPELRRKSFEDLHILWYKCIKERNVLLRESQLLKTMNPEITPNDKFKEVSEEIRNTMWRIRHVLSERNHAWMNAVAEFQERYGKLIKSFKKEYLGADASRDVEMAGQLERFQYMIYGLNPMLEGNEPTELGLEGMRVVSEIKLQRFSEDIGNVGDASIGELRDINERFIVFTADHTPEGLQEAVSSIKAYRETGKVVPPEEEILVFADLIAKTQEPAEEDQL
ncbi:large ribosomal subunit protein uL29m [Trichomonascus vanleenenianus]|uniref:mitochondrial 54S ribosomal protein uL29m MRPL4 n=1 Tax=Trichomonascus vanleenenianus TaxID=2268995 RepID=UPI003ECB96FB